MANILVFDEKYGPRPFDVSEEGARDIALLLVLRERFKEGWYYAPDNPVDRFSATDKAYYELSDEEIENLPTVIRDTAKQVKARVREHLEDEEYQADKENWEDILRLTSLPFKEALSLSWNGRSLVEIVMRDRRDHQYEDFYDMSPQKPVIPNE